MLWYNKALHSHQFSMAAFFWPWWRHQMETFSALLAICAGNSPVPGEFPTQRLVTRSFDVLFDLRLNKRLSKQSRGWWFQTLSRPLWRHCNAWSRYTHGMLKARFSYDNGYLATVNCMYMWNNWVSRSTYWHINWLVRIIPRIKNPLIARDLILHQSYVQIPFLYFPRHITIALRESAPIHLKHMKVLDMTVMFFHDICWKKYTRVLIL